MLRSDHLQTAGSGADPSVGASVRVSCTWCGRLHAASTADAFSPTCSGCADKNPILRTLDMSGSYPLDDDAIDRVLTRRGPGNYALGFMDAGSFVVFYLGRSDSDVRERLHEWVGVASRPDRQVAARRAAWSTMPGNPLPRPMLGPVDDAGSAYTRFAYSYAKSPEAAFAKECRNYSDFGETGELDNEEHPSADA